MTNDKQTQRASGQSVAIQANSDVNIGVDAKEVMQIVSQGLQIHTAAARAHVDDRLDEFEKRILEKLATAPQEATESFASPDMQGALFDAQKAYVRSDSEELHLVLADLILRKAQETKRNRTSLAINDAITKSAFLTKTDFATITFLFYILNVGITGKITVKSIAQRFEKHLEPVWQDIDLQQDTLDYLFSQGLILSDTGSQVARSNPLGMVLANKFSEALNTGFTIDELGEFTPDLQLLNRMNLIEHSEFDKEKFYIKQTEKGLDRLFAKNPVFSDFGAKYKAASKKKALKAKDAIDALAQYYPDIEHMRAKYDVSNAGLARLSPAGFAIAHSYLSSVSAFDGALSLWI